MIYKVPILCEKRTFVEYEILVNAKDLDELKKLLEETHKKNEIFEHFDIANEQILKTIETYSCELPEQEEYKYFEHYEKNNG